MPIPLAPADYYRLRYLQVCAERDAAQAQAIAFRAAHDAAQTAATFTAALQAAGYAHHFDASLAYTWDDAHTALVPPAGTGETS